MKTRNWTCFFLLLHHYYDIISQWPVSVGCFCCRNGSPQLTLALCPTEWSHSRFVSQRAGDENGCPLRNSRNFHLALPASVGVRATEVSGIAEVVSWLDLCSVSWLLESEMLFLYRYILTLGWCTSAGVCGLTHRLAPKYLGNAVTICASPGFFFFYIFFTQHPKSCIQKINCAWFTEFPPETKSRHPISH